MDLRITLKNIINSNSEQEELAKDYLDLLNKHGSFAFDRKCFDWHFTWSVLVLNKTLDKCLLMNHKKLNFWVNFWWHSDLDEDIENVAIRELEEESCIKINKSDLLKNFLNLDKHIIPEKWNEPEHYHYDFRFITIIDENIKFEKQECEVNDIRWFNLNEINTTSKNTFSSWLFKIIDAFHKFQKNNLYDSKF